MIIRLLLVVLVLGASCVAAPVPLIFDTDMGNDIDDALALGVIHALQNRGECELLAVTITKDNRFAAPFVDAIDTFYGRGDVPIGVVRHGKTPEDSKYLTGVVERFPHDVADAAKLPDAIELLRKTLAAQADHSVVIAQVGFSTNLARLIEAEDGRDLVKRKVRLLSMMAGNFSASPKREYNIFIDADSARKALRDWPTPIVMSGYEIGESILYPATSIERDYSYVPHHPLREAYELYMKMPYDRPCWDLTSVLYAVRPDAGIFDLSPPGEVTVDEKEITRFQPAADGKVRYLIASKQQCERARDTLVKLASEPPAKRAVIDSFRGEHEFLSNFFPAKVEFEGHSYSTAEHAYQAAKFTDEAMRKRVAEASSPAAAKRIAHAATTQRPNWDVRKFEVMEAVVRDKFTHNADLQAKLLATGDAELIEGNSWGDTIWGVFQGQGENRLGKILMQVRSELRSNQTREREK